MSKQKLSAKEKKLKLGCLLEWFTLKENSNLIFISLIILCAFVFFADFTYIKYGHFWIEEYPGFYGLYGFVMFTLIIIFSKILRNFVRRSEDYYHENSIDNESYPLDQIEKKNHNDV
tara:strand:- start:236 stop:586 length:351 start_codon:yes stop_codon:yes gene_type:complete